VIPESVRCAALFPPIDTPAPPPEHPFSQVERDGYTIGWLAGQDYGTAVPVSLGDVDAAVEDVRTVLRAQGRTRAGWLVAEAAEPAGLAERLLASGMTPWEGAPFEPRAAAMALVREPEGAAGVEAHPVESFEEFQAAFRVSFDAFDMPEEMRAGLEGQMATLWEMQQRYDDLRSFAALVDGEVVAGATILYGRNAAYLAGGYTRADMRGRGVYRALVRARWDAAVARGTPALTVTAGKMSRPILERLGFEIVGWVDALQDDLGGVPPV
jgi:GNAT superfamily N-acetyltransferase